MKNYPRRLRAARLGARRGLTFTSGALARLYEYPRLEKERDALAGKPSALADSFRPEVLVRHELFTDPPESWRAAFDDHRDAVLDEAAEILQGRRAVFGRIFATGPEDTTRVDLYSGRTWPARYFRQLSMLEPLGGSDPRTAWELGHCHHIVKLAQAYALTGQDDYARACAAEISAWRRDNPFARGPHWTVAMEAAIRLVNWLWAAALCWRSPAWDVKERERFAVAAAEHVELIRALWPVPQRARQNHYLADVVALFTAAAMLPGLSDSGRIRAWTLGEVCECARKHVYDDGVQFENSTSYQCLVQEMLVHAAHVARGSGLTLPPDVEQRIAAMGAATEALRHPDGCLPAIGDGGAGRWVVLGDYFPYWRPAGWGHAHAVLAAHSSQGLPHDVPFDPELWWLGARPATDGPPARTDDARPGGASGQAAAGRALPDGGLYVLRSAAVHCVAACAPTGVHGSGPHRHNDSLSFEISLCGERLVIDAGTSVYQQDPAARARDRATCSHNCLVVDGLEQSPLEGLFGRARNDIHPRVETWTSAPEHVELAATDDGYAALSGVRHVRRFILRGVPERLDVVDEVEGAGLHRLDWFLHFHPGAQPVMHTARESGCEVRFRQGSLSLSVDGADVRLQQRLERRPYSPAYREVREHDVLHLWVERAPLPLRARFRFAPASDARPPGPLS